MLRQERDFSTRLIYSNKKIKEIWMNMVNTTYNSTEDMNIKLQELKGKTKLKFYKNFSDYHDNMNIRMDQDLFAENAQGISKIYLVVLLLMKFLRNKPQVKNMEFIYYDLYYTVIKNKDENDIVDNHYENIYINFNDFITPDQYIGRKNNEIKKRNLRSWINHFNKFILYK